jgi:hypothetical protein
VIFHSRRDRGPDPFLSWKVQILLGAGLLAVLGIGMESSPLVILAILLLLVGVGLRVVGRNRGDDSEAVDAEEDQAEEL